jgi:hypothetical protein
MPPLPPPYRGPFCTELTRVVPTDEIADCVASSGIDIANAATGGVIPVSAAEREALRVDSGDTEGGMTFDQLDVGLRKRYGLQPRRFKGKQQILGALDDGFALVVFGMYDTLPRKRRFQQKSDFLHAMFFNRRDAKTVFHADPLAGRSHKGSQMPHDVFFTFAGSNGFDALGLREAGAPKGGAAKQGGPNKHGGPNMAQTTVTLTPIDPPIEISYEKGTERFSATGRASNMVKPGKAHVDARAFIEQSDDRVPHGHGFLRIADRGSAGFFLGGKDPTVKVIAGTLPVDVDCDGEIAPLRAEIERLNAQIEALQGPDDQP